MFSRVFLFQFGVYFIVYLRSEIYDRLYFVGFFSTLEGILSSTCISDNFYCK